jgi:hypothetical protein
LSAGISGDIAPYIVLGSGSSTNLLGDLTIAVKPSAVTTSFDGIVDYSLFGIALPFVAGAAPIMISTNSSAPLTLTKTVGINSSKATYALVLVGVFIKNLNDVQTPVPFSITFSWAVAK